MRHLLAPLKALAGGSEKIELIEFEPRYSVGKALGHCLKCLVRQEYETCLRRLLRDEGEDKKLEERYEAVVSFLKSPELARLRNESEKYLTQEKKPRIVIFLDKGQFKSEIRLH